MPAKLTVSNLMGKKNEMQGLGLVHGFELNLILTYKSIFQTLIYLWHSDSSTARLNTPGILGMILEFESI